MPREYRHMQEYQSEILKMKSEGMTLQEIGEKFGLADLIRECQLETKQTSYKTGTTQNVELVLSTIREAKKKEKVTKELQLHSDQGFQYTLNEYIYFYNHKRIQPKTKLTPIEFRNQFVA